MAVLPSREAKDFGGGEYDFENLSEDREEEIRFRLDEARDALDAMPESELLKLRKENVELELEVYRTEHDNTGAYKFKRFGNEVSRLFVGEEEGARPALEQAPDGSFMLGPELEGRRVIFIDMLELDRLNKEGGGHDVGDMGLVEASRIIRELAAKYGDYEIFRSGGNQFMLDMKGLSDEDYSKLMGELSSARVSAKEGLDPAPLVANGVDFRDAVEDLNLLQAELGPDARLEPHEAGRELTGILMRSAEWGSEIRKLTARAGRVREMLENDPEKAKEFFDNYVKKAFNETPFRDLEDFKRLIEDGTFDDAMRELAFDQAHKRFEIDRSEDAETEAGAHRIARDRIVWERAEAHRGAKKTERKGEGLAEIPERTKGEERLDELGKALEDARERAKEDPSEINEEAVTRAALELQLEKARRDGGTGLLERGVYYEDLEKAIAENEPVTAVFVDMGFLKYFDKQGGRDVGNDALRLAASLMERAIEDAGVEGKAYRYGGDEFTLLVKGGQEEARKVLRSLAILNEEAGAVPAGAKSKDDYVPTELQFSHGMADMEAMRQLAEGSGERLSENQMAELMTRIADVGVEYLKAADRFEYLIEQMTHPDYRDPTRDEGPTNDHTRQVESKIAYSNKALLAELGGESVLRVFAEEIRNIEKLPPEEREGLREEIDGRIRRFVLERVDASREKDAEHKALLDRLVEMRTRMGYLQRELDEVRAKEKAGSARIKTLEEEKNKTEKDFAALAEVRGKLNG